MAMITPSQLKAAHDESKTIRVVAGPGTGKSACIEARIVWLLNKGVKPESIYVISFTRAAAEDLGERIKKYCIENGCKDGIDRIRISTAHSLALKILRSGRMLAFPENPIVMDNWELENIFDLEYGYEHKVKPSYAEIIRKAYEAAWNTLDQLELRELKQDDKREFDVFIELFSRMYNCILPGEMVKKCLDNIEKGLLEPVELTAAEHLIVDEYQDMNRCDQGFLLSFKNGGTVFFIAGDDDQSIYSFRHADPKGLIEFAEKFPGTSTHILPDCFRCTPTVLTPALELVSHNSIRVKKALTSIYYSATPPVPGVFYSWKYEDGESEASGIAESCALLIKHKVRPSKILILISDRDTQVPLIGDSLKKAGVPFLGPQGARLNSMPDVRAILAILRIINNKDDYLAYRTLLGLLSNVGPAICVKIKNICRDKNANFKNLFNYPLPANIFSPTVSKILMQINKGAAALKECTIDDTLDKKKDKLIDAVSLFFGAGNKFTIQIIKSLEYIISQLPSESSFKEFLEVLRADTDAEQDRAIGHIKERLNIVSEDAKISERVRMMTFHGAKGLNADVVFTPGLEVGLLPNRKGLEAPGLMEEQRRLFYVGITRARAACIVTFAKTRKGRQAQRLTGKWSSDRASSPFLSELGVTTENRKSGLTDLESKEIQKNINMIQAYWEENK